MTSADQHMHAANAGNEGQATPLPLIFPSLPAHMGDYKLTHLLGSHRYSDFYVARQSHVERRVVLEVLRPLAGSDGTQEEFFLAHARARVAAHPPHTAQVLESTTSPEGYCYISQHLPEGTTLAAMSAAGKQLTVQQVCSLIITAGELYEACANTALAAGPLKADMVFMTRTGSFTFLSPVLADTPAEGDSSLQMQVLAAAILPAQPTNVQGQSRVATLLSWMLEGYEGRMLDWPTITNTAAIILEQLKLKKTLHINRPINYDKGREERASLRRRKRQRRHSLLIGAAVLTIISMGVGGIFLTSSEPALIPAILGQYASCKVEDKVEHVLAHPVSMAEYQQYLAAYRDIDAARRGSITMDVPPAETDPTPADWNAMLAAAESGSEWQGRHLSMDSAVTNVSYWQALMYARWQRASLPQATLLAAVRAATPPTGIEEWTQDTRPATPPYTAARIVLPDTNDASPIPENDPATRTPQRGFRICR